MLPWDENTFSQKDSYLQFVGDQLHRGYSHAMSPHKPWRQGPAAAWLVSMSIDHPLRNPVREAVLRGDVPELCPVHCPTCGKCHKAVSHLFPWSPGAMGLSTCSPAFRNRCRLCSNLGSSGTASPCSCHLHRWALWVWWCPVGQRHR